MTVDERFASIFLGKNPTTSARLLESMETKQAADVLRAATIDIVGPILQKMLPAVAARCLASLGSDYIARLLPHLPGQTAAAILRQFSPEDREAALKPVNAAQTAALRLLLRYPPNTVGAWMDPQVLTLAHDYSIREARDKLDEVDPVQTKIYVLDRDRRLIGAVDIRTLHQCERHGSIELLLEIVEPVRARESVETVRKMELWDHDSHVPLINRHNEFVGVASFADIRRAHRQLEQPTVSVSPDSEGSSIVELLLTGLACTWQNVEDIILNPDRNTKEGR
jgi:magnesium transporter